MWRPLQDGQTRRHLQEHATTNARASPRATGKTAADQPTVGDGGAVIVGKEARDTAGRSGGISRGPDPWKPKAVRPRARPFIAPRQSWPRPKAQEALPPCR
jgi:hypothetical protein